MPDLVSEAWNATERSRAQTRALLTALSRDRSRVLLPRPFIEALLAAFTLTIASAWRISRRLIALERLTWSQLLEFASWTSSFAAIGEKPTALVRWADYRRTTAESRLRSAIAAAASAVGIGLSMYAFILTRSPNAHVAPARFDLAAGWRMLLMIVGAAWTLQLFRLSTHRWHLTGWLREINLLLSDQQRRTIALKTYEPADLVAVVFCFAVVVGQPFTSWPIALAPAAFTLIAGWKQVRLERRMNLQLIERLLEWMDDTGLPVEYEVTALNPDEIAAMIG